MEFNKFKETTAKRVPERGEVYYIEQTQSRGSEQKGDRPGIIVSNMTGNTFSDIYEIVYLTSQPKSSLPTRVEINSCRMKSTALCEQITTVAADRLHNYISKCTEEEMKEIDRCLKVSLGLKDNNDKFNAGDNRTLLKAQEHITTLTARCKLLQQAVEMRNDVQYNFKISIGNTNVCSVISNNQIQEMKSIAMRDIDRKIALMEESITEYLSLSREAAVVPEADSRNKEEPKGDKTDSATSEGAKQAAVEWNIEEVKELLKEHVPVQKIADRYGITKSICYRRMSNEGISPKQYR